MSTRILLASYLLLACQEAPPLVLDPVADGSVDAGPEALELTKLWVTALPPLPAIHFEEEDRTYPLKLWHRIPVLYDPPTLMAEFANAIPSQFQSHAASFASKLVLASAGVLCPCRSMSQV